MTVRGFLEFAAELRGLTGDAKRKAVARVVERCFLESVLHQSIDTLSKGYRHRTCLAQALIHDPEVLILDEPTDGLDPNQKHEVRNLIRELGKTKAIVFSTHILEEVDAACTRAIIIDRGRIVANGTPEELRNMSDLAGAVTLSGARRHGWRSCRRCGRVRGPRRRVSASIPKRQVEGRRAARRRGGARRTARAGRWKACTASAASSTKCSAASRCRTP